MAKAQSKKTINPQDVYKKFKKLSVDPINRKYIKTGCNVLDDILTEGKGLPLGCFIEFTSQTGIGKCVTGDTIVCVNNVFQKIKNGINQDGFSEAEGEILSDPFASLEDAVDTYSHKYREFVDTIVTLNDVHGNTISCTPSHPLLVVTNDNACVWKQAKDIQLGDNIIMRATTTFEDIPFNSKKYIEGYSIDHTIQNTSGDSFLYVLENDVSFIRNVLEKAEYVCKNESNVKLDTRYYYNEYTHEKSNKQTRYYYKINGIEFKNDFYEPMTLEELLNKVCGMFDNNNALLRDDVISFQFTSEQNAIDFQKMMATIGFVGHRSRIQTYKYSDCLKLTKSSSFHLAKTLLSLTKTRKLELLSYINKLQNIYATNNNSGNNLFGIEESRSYNTCTVSEKKVIFDKQFVYDYSIPESHRFIANGFVSHNTTIMLDIAKHVIEEGKKVLYIDAECGINEGILESTGLINAYNDDNFMLFSTSSFNNCGELLDAAVADPEVSLIVIDSITALIPDELTDIDKKISDGQIGIHSRYTGNLLTRYKNKINNSEKTIVFINQMRKKIPMGYGHANDEPAGGNAQRFSMDIRLMMKKIDYVFRDESKETPIGSINEIWAIKNRIVLPNIHRQIKLLYGKGIDDDLNYESWLINNGIVEQGSAGWYTINWNGEQKKIKGKNKYTEWVKENLEEIKSFIDNAESKFMSNYNNGEYDIDDDSLSELESDLE